MTTSPTLTSSGTRWPLSSMRPGPTAMTVPSCGFSLAVSGMTRPEAVVVSASLAWTTTRSSSGLMVTLVAVVTSATPPSVSDGWWVLMLWHGVGPAVAGIRRQPVSLALYPRECQPLNRVLRVGGRRSNRRVGEAGGVPADPLPDDGVAALHWLQGPDGAAAVERAGRLQAEGVDLLPGLGRLRAEFGAEHAGPAWELARLRTRARPVFGADADVLYLTADTLEQAGRPQLAARRARRLLAGGADSAAGPRRPPRGPRRLLAGGADSAADLGCAAGTDAIALARAGASVLAVDRDPLARELTVANATALGLADRVWVAAGDVEELVEAARGGEVAGCAAATLDPGRRAEGRRQLHPDRWSPPWPTVEALLDRVPRSVVKVAPGLDHDRVPEGVPAEPGGGR